FATEDSDELKFICLDLDLDLDLTFFTAAVGTEDSDELELFFFGDLLDLPFFSTTEDSDELEFIRLDLTFFLATDELELFLLDNPLDDFLESFFKDLFFDLEIDSDEDDRFTRFLERGPFELVFLLLDLEAEDSIFTFPRFCLEVFLLTFLTNESLELPDSISIFLPLLLFLLLPPNLIAALSRSSALPFSLSERSNPNSSK